MPWFTALIEHTNLQMVPALFKSKRLEGVALFTAYEKLEDHIVGTTTLEWEGRELGENLTAEELLVTLDAMLMFCADYRAAVTLPVYLDPKSFVHDPQVKPDYESLGMFLRTHKLIKCDAELVELFQKKGFTVALNHFKERDTYACVVCRGLFVDPNLMREAVAAFNNETTEDLNVNLTDFGSKDAVVKLALEWIEQVA